MSTSSQKAGKAGGQGSRSIHVAICGGINWDIICVGRLPDPGETCNATSFKQLPGGKGANTAVALHRLSHFAPEPDGALERKARNFYADAGLDEIRPRMIGSVGGDKLGKRMVSLLEGKGVDTALVVTQAEDCQSAVANIWVDSKGQNRHLVYTGANHCLEPSHFEDESAFGTPAPALVIAHLELETYTVEKLLRTAKAAGLKTLFNPAPAQWLDSEVYEGLTHLILNETEAAILSALKYQDVARPEFDWNKVADEFLEYGVENVVITLSERGAFFSNKKGGGCLVPAEPIDRHRIMDTSGAGDTFVGAYAVQYIKATQSSAQNGWDIKSAVVYACKAAAHTIQAVGCQDSIPWADGLVQENRAA